MSEIAYRYKGQENEISRITSGRPTSPQAIRLAGSHSKNPSRSSTDMDHMDNMDILLNLRCIDCRKSFTVDEENVEDDQVFCPHCQNEVPVPDMDEE